MTRIYTENDLVLPALHFMEQNGGTITTAKLIPRMENHILNRQESTLRYLKTETTLIFHKKSATSNVMTN